jgi:hypothetical protein
MMKFIPPSPVSSQATIASGLSWFKHVLSGDNCKRLFGKLLVRTQATGEDVSRFNLKISSKRTVTLSPSKGRAQRPSHTSLRQAQTDSPFFSRHFPFSVSRNFTTLAPSPVSSQATIASGFSEFSPALAGYHCKRLFGMLLVRAQATGDDMMISQTKQGPLRFLPWGRGGRGLINDAYQIARRNPSLPSRNPSHLFRWEGITIGISTTLLVPIMLCFLGCSSNKTNSSNIKINLTPDKHSLNITGLDPLIVQDISRDSLGGNWQSLVPVYKMPADTDMKNYQPIQPGKYLVKDSIVVFTPDTPFVARQTYFVRYYNFDTNTKAADYIMGHNKLGDLHYTDLIFKQ